MYIFFSLRILVLLPALHLPFFGLSVPRCLSNFFLSFLPSFFVLLHFFNFLYFIVFQGEHWAGRAGASRARAGVLGGRAQQDSARTADHGCRWTVADAAVPRMGIP